MSTGTKWPSLALSTAAHGARTHVRLGARRRGEPRLPGQHRGDVEVCDVHVPCRDKSSTQNGKPHPTPRHSHASNSLWKLSLSILASRVQVCKSQRRFSALTTSVVINQRSICWQTCGPISETFKLPG